MAHPHDDSLGALDDPFGDVLNEDPRIAFFGQQKRFGRGQQRKFFEGQFQNILNKFLGNLGGRLFENEIPDQRFPDFIKNFDFDSFFRSQSPSFRGGFRRNVTPRGRSLFEF